MSAAFACVVMSFRPRRRDWKHESKDEKTLPFLSARDSLGNSTATPRGRGAEAQSPEPDSQLQKEKTEKLAFCPQGVRRRRVAGRALLSVVSLAPPS